jgi:hypothetical protein
MHDFLGDYWQLLVYDKNFASWAVIDYLQVPLPKGPRRYLQMPLPKGRDSCRDSKEGPALYDGTTYIYKGRGPI